jgi:hypothetical protein
MFYSRIQCLICYCDLMGEIFKEALLRKSDQ